MSSRLVENPRTVRLRPVEERSITHRLQRWAEESSTKVAVRCASSERQLTYSELVEQGSGFAAELRSAGAASGAHIGNMMPNGMDWAVTWAGCTLGGFVDVGIDPEAHGNLLRHYVSSADVALIVCVAEQVGQVRAAGISTPLLVWGGAESDASATSVRLPLSADASAIVHRDPRDDMSIRFTSGTTGPAKPAVLTQSHLEVWATHFTDLMEVSEDDVLYTPFPLSHHLASVMGVLGMTFAGATCVIDERFSLSRFWATVRREGATRLHVLQPVINLLMSVPPSPDDRDNPATLAYIGVPGTGFEERFGVGLLTAYGLTEGSMLTYMVPGDPGPTSPEAIALGGLVLGRANPHFDVAILDEWDHLCPAGEKGILCFRPRSPFLSLQRYHNFEAATVSVARNQWFHTGDLGCLDDEGYLHFFGRSGDTIRRKGYNIPIFHVEEAARGIDGVREACVIPIAAPGDDFDLKLIAVVAPGTEVNPRDVMAQLERELPRVMVPSYIEIRTEVPRTRTYKIVKAALKEEGVGGLTTTTLRTSDWSPAIPAPGEGSAQS